MCILTLRKSRKLIRLRRLLRGIKNRFKKHKHRKTHVQMKKVERH